VIPLKHVLQVLGLDILHSKAEKLFFDYSFNAPSASHPEERKVDMRIFLSALVAALPLSEVPLEEKIKMIYDVWDYDLTDRLEKADLMLMLRADSCDMGQAARAAKKIMAHAQEPALGITWLELYDAVSDEPSLLFPESARGVNGDRTTDQTA
jgi:Ca2+-binding EF-hand superfamily protein